jgi:NAD(P)-dependent dehydrogenase (short-subunit alcohol dehydrogenase family)
MKLNGKTAVVTGAASGIGRATALALAAEGARLIVCDVNQPGLDQIAAELGAACTLARGVDVSKRDEMRAFADAVHALVPAVDILVNNAGVGLQGGLLETSLEDWDWVLGVNLGGVIHGCHLFVPKMIERRAGHVVNVSSVLGYFGAPGIIGYVTSKFGVLGLSESLRAEAEPHGVSVSTICPGVIDTGIVAATKFSTGEHLRARVQDAYHKRAYGPEKVAAAIVKAIKKRQPVVPVSPEAWVLYFLKRFVPGLGGPLGRAMARRVSGA